MAKWICVLWIGLNPLVASATMWEWFVPGLNLSELSKGLPKQCDLPKKCFERGSCREVDELARANDMPHNTPFIEVKKKLWSSIEDIQSCSILSQSGIYRTTFTQLFSRVLKEAGSAELTPNETKKLVNQFRLSFKSTTCITNYKCEIVQAIEKAQGHLTCDLSRELLKVYSNNYTKSTDTSVSTLNLAAFERALKQAEVAACAPRGSDPGTSELGSDAAQ